MREIVVLYACLYVISRMIFMTTAVSLLKVLVNGHDYRMFVVNVLICALVYLLEQDMWDRMHKEPIKSQLDEYLESDER